MRESEPLTRTNRGHLFLLSLGMKLMKSSLGSATSENGGVHETYIFLTTLSLIKS
jgi:hypothetical protein